MATERFRNLPIERQELILNAAMTEFATAGFDKGNLQNIARAAGVTKGLLYYYFEDRQDLLASLYEQVAGRVISIVGPVPTKLNSAQFWEWIGQVYRRFSEEVSLAPVLMAFMGRVMAEMAQGHPPPGFEKRILQTNRAIDWAVSLGRSCGAIRKDLPDELLRRVVMSLITTCDHWLLSQAEKGKLSPKDAALVLSIYKSALAPAPRKRNTLK